MVARLDVSHRRDDAAARVRVDELDFLGYVGISAGQRLARVTGRARTPLAQRGWGTDLGTSERDLHAVSTRRKELEMSVANHLGLTDPDNDVLALARQRWPSWQASHEPLRVVDDLLDLPDWLRAADWAAADRVLLALAELSAPDGGDDVAATGALAWVLLPGASLLAFRLGRLCHRIDEVLAAQLWVEARTFPWRHGQKVAANILMNTRKGVMRDLGIGQRADPTWARSIPVDPGADMWLDAAHYMDYAFPRPAEELQDLLELAQAKSVVSDADVELLLSLAVAADRARPARSGRGNAGLMAPAASEAVARSRGVSARTVRRHAARSVHALRAVWAADQRVPI